jgi:hypothetical protein
MAWKRWVRFHELDDSLVKNSANRGIELFVESSIHCLWGAGLRHSLIAGAGCAVSIAVEGVRLGKEEVQVAQNSKAA